jgi:hypothetical protein
MNYGGGGGGVSVIFIGDVVNASKQNYLIGAKD